MIRIKTHGLLAALLGLGLGLSCAAGDAHPTAQKPEAVQMKGAAVGQWTMDLDAAKALAAEKRLPILLNFTGSDWCGVCIRMDKAIFSKPVWKKMSANLVLVTLDFPRTHELSKELSERNETLARQFGIRGFPTFVLLDEDGATELGRVDNIPMPYAFDQALQNVLSKRSKAVADRVASMPPETAKIYQAAIAAKRAAQAKLDEWMASQPPPNEENLAKFFTFREELLKNERAAAMAEVAAFTTAAGAEAGGHYKAAHEALFKAEDEQFAWLKTQPPQNDESRQAFMAFEARMEQQRTIIADLEMRQHAAKLPPEKRKRLTAIHESLAKIDAERRAFLESTPQPTPEAEAKMAGFSERQEQLLAELIDYR
jgi:protein disulfide-isomerase